MFGSAVFSSSGELLALQKREEVHLRDTDDLLRARCAASPLDSLVDFTRDETAVVLARHEIFLILDFRSTVDLSLLRTIRAQTHDARYCPFLDILVEHDRKSVWRADTGTKTLVGNTVLVFSVDASRFLTQAPGGLVVCGGADRAGGTCIPLLSVTDTEFFPPSGDLLFAQNDTGIAVFDSLTGAMVCSLVGKVAFRRWRWLPSVSLVVLFTNGSLVSCDARGAFSIGKLDPRCIAVAPDGSRGLLEDGTVARTERLT